MPLAARYFGDAIRGMTLEDVHGILTGGNTAATDFFRRKTGDQLYTAFKPVVVSEKVNQVGATRAYRDMMGRYEKMPLMGSQSLDLDDYVTKKSLDGLFLVLARGEEDPHQPGGAHHRPAQDGVRQVARPPAPAARRPLREQHDHPRSGAHARTPAATSSRGASSPAPGRAGR